MNLEHFTAQEIKTGYSLGQSGQCPIFGPWATRHPPITGPVGNQVYARCL